jgi:hypothetical protein
MEIDYIAVWKHRHPPVLSGRRQRHLNPVGYHHARSIRMNKSQNRSQGHTCRRSGSDLSYIGIDATGLKIKVYYH